MYYGGIYLCVYTILTMFYIIMHIFIYGLFMLFERVIERVIERVNRFL